MDKESVRFTWKDYRNGNQNRQVSLPGCEFVRRFLGRGRMRVVDVLRPASCRSRAPPAGRRSARESASSRCAHHLPSDRWSSARSSIRRMLLAGFFRFRAPTRGRGGTELARSSGNPRSLALREACPCSRRKATSIASASAKRLRPTNCTRVPGRLRRLRQSVQRDPLTILYVRRWLIL
jgi:hypothetical protein